MAPFSKPETVLRQAEGLVSVGQSHAALQLLTETFSSKRFRSTPLISLEPIMLRFIELCVEMRKGRTVKEGLMQYKNIAQNVNAKSIEIVIIRLLGLADEKVKEAQQQAAVAVEIDDLEASETPESILLGAVSGDQNKDRTDRAVVTPWLRFLWESYRTSLETLKNNVRLEAIYQQIAQQAFKFCLKHSRKAEFRRLCETLRTHLTNAAKYSYQQHSINLSDPDTLQHHLDTRFAQLNASVELELWQEAFRSVEDVHNLLTMAKKAPRPAMMANYYEKLTKIFLVSGNALYHAAAWGKYHAIVTSIGGKSDGEMSRLAGKVLVSALAVPVGLQVEEVEELKGRNARLSALLGLVRVPTRAGLLKDALSRGVLKLSPSSIKSLYQVLEVTFDPLSLCSSIAPLFQTLSMDSAYSPYLPLLQRALLSRLLNQLSQVYSNVKIATLLELVQPLKFEATEEGEKSVFNAEEIEAYIMGCARRGELNIRVDHKDGSITFIDDAFAVSGDESQFPIASSSRSQSRETTIQPSLAENVHTRLSGIAHSLHDVILLLDGPKPSQEEKLKTLFVQVEAERKALQTKRALVARRRELLSELTVRKEKEESSKRAEIQAREKEEQNKRQREEARKREIELAKKQIEAVRKDEAKKFAQTLVVKGILKANDIQKLDDYDTENLIGMQVAQLEKEKFQTNERLRVTAKHMDHLERAYRKEEQPLLGQDYLNQQAQDKETFKMIKRERLETSKLAHTQDLETKTRLQRMVEDHKIWKGVVEEKKKEAYKKKQEAARKNIDVEKEKRREQVLKAWEEEKARREEEEEEKRIKEEEEREREEARRAEEERLRLEEEARLAAEEAARKKREEEAAAQRAQRDKERQEAVEQAKFQRQREQEAEERRQQRRLDDAAAAKASQSSSGRGMPANRGTSATEMEWRRSSSGAGGPRSLAASAVEPLPRSGSPGPAKYRPGASGGGGSGGWRERERAKVEAAANGAPKGPGNGLLDKTSTPAQSLRDKDSNKELRKDEDGFTTVTKTGTGSGVWKSKRGGGR